MDIRQSVGIDRENWNFRLVLSLIFIAWRSAGTCVPANISGFTPGQRFVAEEPPDHNAPDPNAYTYVSRSIRPLKVCYVAVRSRLTPFLSALIIPLALWFGFFPAVANSQAVEKSASDAVMQRFLDLDRDVTALKRDILKLSEDLLYLEEESLISPSAQLVVFLALNPRSDLDISTLQVRLELDGQVVSNHFYEPHEINALRRGGYHRLYLGSLPVGDHELIAHFSGTARSTNKPVTAARATLNFRKDWDRKTVFVDVDWKGKNKPPKVAFSERE